MDFPEIQGQSTQDGFRQGFEAGGQRNDYADWGGFEGRGRFRVKLAAQRRP